MKNRGKTRASNIKKWESTRIKSMKAERQDRAMKRHICSTLKRVAFLHQFEVCGVR